MARDIFISHSSRDKSVAESVCAALEGAGYRCWIAPRDITPGMDWSQAIVEGIHECALTVLIFSGHANASVAVTREVQRAFEGGSLVLPFRIEDVVPTGALEYYLSSVQWLDALGPSRDAGVGRLVESVGYLVGNRPDSGRKGGDVTPTASYSSAPSSSASATALQDVPTSVHTSLPVAVGARPAAAHNLPQMLTSFVGRDEEVRRIREMLGGARLVTLTGPGGTGKTRLAVEVGTRLAGERVYPGGIWLAELAPLSDGARLAQTVAAAVGAQDGGATSSWEEALVRRFGDARALLVLDNCEHLVEESARLAATLLRACPNLHILATSQHLLHVPGERRFLVPPLEHPNPAREHSLAELRQFESVRLFVDRAVTVAPNFALDEGNAAPVARICYHLDGIPLAIEFAAARVRAMRVEVISERLDDRFRLLRAESALLPTRQRTLQAAIEWSHTLLSEQEQTLLRRLAVFSGGCTLEAAESVCSGGSIDEWEVFDVLTWLVDKSLVRFEDADDQMGRYRLLESVRQFAGERLREIGEWDDCARRHCDYFLKYAEAGSRLGCDQQALSMRRVEVEVENLRNAIRYCRATGDIDAELRFVDLLHWFWGAKGMIGELREHVSSLLEKREALDSQEKQASILQRAAHLARYQCDFAAARHYADMILDLRRKEGDPKAIATALLHRCMMLHAASEFAEARASVEEAVELYDSLGETQDASYARQWLAALISAEGDAASALQMLEGCKQQMSESPWAMAWLGLPLGTAAHRVGDRESSYRYLQGSLEAFTRLGDTIGLVFAVERYAGLAALAGETELAARLYGATEQARQRYNCPLAPGDVLDFYEKEQEVARRALGPAPFAERFAEGRCLSVEEAVRLAQETPLPLAGAA